MAGEKSLDKLIANMTPVLSSEVYVFACVPPDFKNPNLRSLMHFEEAEGLTLIVEQNEAQRHDIEYAFPCRHITLNIHSSLDAIGFIAKIAASLSENGISVNPVAGFYHDHLFVPVEKADIAMKVLNMLIDKTNNGAR